MQYTPSFIGVRESVKFRASGAGTPGVRHSPRLALALLLACLWAPTALAQPTVTVEINGIEDKLETNVRLFLSIEQQKNHPLLSPEQLRRLHKKASGEIASALEPYGYYRPVVDGRLVQESEDEWRAVYEIDPGARIPVATFELTLSQEMHEDPEFVALLEKRQVREGMPFSHVEYDEFKSSLSRLANERGYFAAKFRRHRVEIDLDAYVARIYLDYDGGPRHVFGEIKIDQSVLDDDLLWRFVNFSRGDPYTLNRLLELQRALTNSDYFQSVEISPGEPIEGTIEVPIDVVLTPRKRHRFDLGVGYGTDTGARTKFGWKMPRVNRRGHRFDTELRLSEIGHSLLANYRVPVLNPRTDQIVYSIGEVEEDFESGTSNKRTVGVSLNHGRGAWRETLSLDYQLEDFSIDNESDTSTLLIPGVSWSRTWGRDFINVLDGLRFDIGLRGASESLVSDTSFAQLRGSLKFITSLGPRDRIIMRGGFGTTETRDFDDIPSSLRFYAGGSNSVRGYAYQSLGPTDDDGEAIGGRYLLQGSVEYEHYFDDRWGMALFYDIGNAVDDLNDDLERGAGFGLRWKSPVGPIRVDLANAITSDDEDWRLHINIGPDL